MLKITAIKSRESGNFKQFPKKNINNTALLFIVNIILFFYLLFNLKYCITHNKKFETYKLLFENND